MISTASSDPAIRAYITWVLPALWLLVGVASLDVARRVCRTQLRGPLPPLLLLTLGALTLRLTLPPGGWGDQRSTFADAFTAWGTMADWGTHGRAIEALFSLLFSLLAPNIIRADAIWFERLNLLAGSLAPALLVGVIAGLGLPRRAAWLAGALLAVAPLHVRFAATMNRFILPSSLWLFACGVILWRLRGDPKSGRRLRALGAGAALVLAVQCRPEAAWLPLAALLLPWAAIGVKRWPREVVLTVIFSAALLMLPLWGLAQRVLSAPEWGSFIHSDQSGPPLRGLLSTRHNLVLSGVYTPPGWTLLALWGGIIGLRGMIGLRSRTGTRRATLWLLVWAVISTVVVSASDIDRDLLSGRYHLLALPAWLALVALGGDWILTILPVKPVFQRFMALGLLAMAWGPMPHVVRVTEQEQEVAFYRRVLPQVPDGCALLTFDPVVQDLGVTPGPTLSFSAGKKHSWVRVSVPNSPHLQDAAAVQQAGTAAIADALDNVRDRDCVLWVRGGSCFGVQTSPGFEAERAAVCDGFDALVGATSSGHGAADILDRQRLTHDTIGAHRFHPGPVVVQLAWIRRPGERLRKNPAKTLQNQGFR